MNFHTPILFSNEDRYMTIDIVTLKPVNTETVEDLTDKGLSFKEINKMFLKNTK